MLSRIIVAGAASSLLSPEVRAQCSPWQLESSQGPSPRQNHAMSSDGAAVVLFGGYRGGFGFNAETWLWHAGTWTQSGATGPAARGNFSMSHDTKRGCIVLFGGAGGTGSTFFADTWLWDGGAWVDFTPIPPDPSPAARFNHVTAYDAARDQLVLFGGFNTVRLNDTWLFDPGKSAWTQVFPATVPPARSSHAMAYDAARQRVVMFGGFLGGGVWSDQTWEWNGTDWTLSHATGPSGRQYLGMVYDPGREHVVLSCGQAAGFVRMDDTWSYDGTWTQLSVGTPGFRDQHAMAYDPFDARVLLHGGYTGGGSVLSDTWSFACGPCYTDCNEDGALTVADFGCFQTRFAAGDMYCDCNGTGTLTVADFGCFQTTFAAIGCP